jgi:L-alanine-DL-glutamate epimerase-like enolase superfamily enzyme
MEKIARVEALRFPMGSSWLVDTVIANPMSLYPRYREKRSSWMRTMTTVIVRVTTTGGLAGLGWVGGGKAAPASLVEDVFADLVVGESPFDTEVLWDRMYRASIPYGRKGAAIEAISGIDTALWDLAGKITEQPVYNLLGGRTRDSLRVYATGNAVESHVRRGFRDVKLAMLHGPADGREGMRANEELVSATRERIGPDGQIMLDCYMGWDEPYTVEMAGRLRQHGIRWIEEPLMPQHLDGYRRLRDLLNPMGILVTGGEHEFTRWGFRELIEKQAVDILQPDIGRAGGISEVKKICALASVHGIPVILHGSGAPAWHLAMSTVNCPCAEYIDMLAGGGTPTFTGEPQPAGGHVELPDTPGFGYELNPLLVEGKPPAPIW